MTTLLLSNSINRSPLLTIPLFPGLVASPGSGPVMSARALRTWEGNFLGGERTRRRVQRWASPPNATAVVHRRASRSRTAGSRFRFLPLVALAGIILLVATLPPAFAQGGSSDYEGPVGVTGIFNGNITTACSYDPLSHNAKRTVTDIVVPGSVGKYPLKMTRYYNSRSQNGAEGLGIGWTHEYSWILTEGVSKLITPQGNVYDTFCGPPVGVSEYWESGPDSNGNGTFRLADGGRVVFQNHGVSSITDPYGLTTTITRDAYSRIWKVTEPGGRYLQFLYYTSGTSLGLLQTVEAHDGQGNTTDSVNYSYTSVPSGGQFFGPSMMLTGVSYYDNTSATYGYEGDNVPDLPGPPFYIFRMYPLLNYCNDVRYNGPMREIAYFYQRGGPHGAILREKNPTVGPISTIAPGLPLRTVPGQMQTNFTETRLDGPTRSFTYTAFYNHYNGENDPCINYDQGNNPPQQMLLQYTDFQNQRTSLGYDPNWYVNSVTDANLHTTSYQRGQPPPQGIGQILTITLPPDEYGTRHTITYTYETNPAEPHYVHSVQNERGYTTTYTRDTDYRVTRIDYPDGGFETFSYNGFGQVLVHQRTNGAYESFAYDGRGLLTDKWNPKFNSIPAGGDPHTHYTYYTSGPWTDRVLTMTLPANTSGFQASETYEYDRDANNQAVAGRGLVTKITHADSKYQSFGYDIYGNKLWEENELRNHTDYGYDSYNRLTTAIRVMTPPDPNETTTYDYSPTQGNVTLSYYHTTKSVYFVTDPMNIVTANGYDPNFRKTSTTQGYGSSSPATTWFHYDNVGNQDYVTDPLNHTTTTSYDARNRKQTVTDPPPFNNQVTTWHYGDGINVTSIDRPDNTTETKTYDPMNRVFTDTVPRNDPTDLITTTFIYYPSGMVHTVQDGNNHITTFEYNAANLKITMTYPNSSDYQSWKYDDAYNLATRRTVHGEIQSFSYDNRNRQTHMGWSNNVDASDFGYDDASRLTSANNPNSAVTRIYDAAGRMTHDIQNVVGVGPLDVQYTRDADGRVTHMGIPGTPSPIYDQSRGYNDPLGRLSAIWDMYRPNMIHYQYDAASNITGRDTLQLNGGSIIYTPDNLNRIARRQVKLGTTTISDETYGHDPMSRLRTVDRTEDGSHDQFGYYLDGELSSAQYTARSVTYTLDKAGNRTNVTDNGTNTTYTPNNLNQYGNVGIDTVTNGSEHEIASYQNVSYTYINDTHLSQVTNAGNTYQLAYDALGRCVSRTVNSGVQITTIYYFYDGEKPIQEIGPTFALWASTVYGIGIDEPVIRFTPAVVYYFNQDHEGSVTHVTYSDTHGNSGLIEQYRYDAFGTPTIRDGSGTVIGASAIGNRFMFTGREWAPMNLGFYEYRARAYHPGVGRFMSEDPKLFDAGDYNLFRYCHNDPEDLTDPMGLWDFEPNQYGSMHDWQITKSYLARDTVMRDIIFKGESLNIRVIPNNQNITSIRNTGPNGRPIIDYDPHSGIRTTEGGRQSPALGVGHEMDHAVRRETDRKGFERDNLPRSDKQYDRREERRVIEGSEAHAAKTLGEDRRFDHKGTFFRTDSPISREPSYNQQQQRQPTFESPHTLYFIEIIH